MRFTGLRPERLGSPVSWVGVRLALHVNPNRVRLASVLAIAAEWLAPLVVIGLLAVLAALAHMLWRKLRTRPA